MSGWKYASSREPTVTCEVCGWSVRNSGDFDLVGELCLYHGCRGEFVSSSVVMRPWELRTLYDNLKVPTRQRP